MFFTSNIQQKLRTMQPLTGKAKVSSLTDVLYLTSEAYAHVGLPDMSQKAIVDMKYGPLESFYLHSLATMCRYYLAGNRPEGYITAQLYNLGSHYTGVVKMLSDVAASSTPAKTVGTTAASGYFLDRAQKAWMSLSMSDQPFNFAKTNMLQVIAGLLDTTITSFDAVRNMAKEAYFPPISFDFSQSGSSFIAQLFNAQDLPIHPNQRTGTQVMRNIIEYTLSKLKLSYQNSPAAAGDYIALASAYQMYLMIALDPEGRKLFFPPSSALGSDNLVVSLMIARAGVLSAMYHKSASVASCIILDYLETSLSSYLSLVKVIDPEDVLSVGFRIKRSQISAMLDLLESLRKNIPTLTSNFTAAGIFRDTYYSGLGAEILLDEYFLTTVGEPFKLVGQDPSEYTDAEKQALSGVLQSMMSVMDADTTNSVTLLEQPRNAPSYDTAFSLYGPSTGSLDYKTVEIGQFLSLATKFINKTVGQLYAPCADLKIYFETSHVAQASAFGTQMSFMSVFDIDLYKKFFVDVDVKTIHFSDFRKQSFFGNDIPRFDSNGTFVYESKVARTLLDFNEESQKAVIKATEGDLRFPCDPEVPRSYDAHLHVDYQFVPFTYAPGSDTVYLINRTHPLMMELIAANSASFEDVQSEYSHGGFMDQLQRLFTMLNDPRHLQHLTNTLISNFIIVKRTDTDSTDWTPVVPTVPFVYGVPVKHLLDANCPSNQTEWKKDILYNASGLYGFVSIKKFPSAPSSSVNGASLVPFTVYNITFGFMACMVYSHYLDEMKDVFNETNLKDLSQQSNPLPLMRKVEEQINSFAVWKEIKFTPIDKLYQTPVKLPGIFPRHRALSFQLQANYTRMMTDYYFGRDEVMSKIRSIISTPEIGWLITPSDYLMLLEAPGVDLRKVGGSDCNGIADSLLSKDHKYFEAMAKSGKEEPSINTASKGSDNPAPVNNAKDFSTETGTDNVFAEKGSDGKTTIKTEPADPKKNKSQMDQPGVNTPAPTEEKVEHPNEQTNPAIDAAEKLERREDGLDDQH